MLLSAIRGYVGPGIDVEAELEALGDRFGELLYIFWNKVAAGKKDHWTFLPFDEFGGIPVYKYSWRKRFCLVAVEDLGDQGMTVWFMAAGREGQRSDLGGIVWDGFDYRHLRATVLHTRLMDLFR
jgi:hypothetical protein